MYVSPSSPSLLLLPPGCGHNSLGRVQNAPLATRWDETYLFPISSLLDVCCPFPPLCCSSLLVVASSHCSSLLSTLHAKLSEQRQSRPKSISKCFNEASSYELQYARQHCYVKLSARVCDGLRSRCWGSGLGRCVVGRRC